jgi:hypothetical protein
MVFLFSTGYVLAVGCGDIISCGENQHAVGVPTQGTCRCVCDTDCCCADAGCSYCKLPGTYQQLVGDVCQCTNPPDAYHIHICDASPYCGNCLEIGYMGNCPTNQHLVGTPIPERNADGQCICNDNYAWDGSNCVCTLGLDVAWQCSPSEADCQECCKPSVCNNQQVCCPKGYVYDSCVASGTVQLTNLEYCENNYLYYLDYAGYYVTSTPSIIYYYGVCKKSCDPGICWDEQCVSKPNTACQSPSTNFLTGCDHHSGCTLIYSPPNKYLCTSTITSSDGTCYSCDSGDDPESELGEYYKCGSETKDFKFVREKYGATCTSISQDLVEIAPTTTSENFADGWGVENMMSFTGDSYPLVFNNLICGSINWYCDDFWPWAADGYVTDYSGWIVKQDYNPTSLDKKVIAKYDVSVSGQACNTFACNSYSYGYTVNLNVGIRSNYDTSRDTEIEVECAAGKSFVPIPLIQPACWDSMTSSILFIDTTQYEGYSAGFYKICPGTSCNGYNLNKRGSDPGNLERNVILNYTYNIGLRRAGTCPNAPALGTVYDQCRNELEDYIQSRCFYDERYDSLTGKYYPPLITDQVVTGENNNVVCACNSTKKTSGYDFPKDCGNNGVIDAEGKSNGYCSNEVTGGLASGINCGDAGWVASNYIEARPKSIYIVNPSGDYTGYGNCPRSEYRNEYLFESPNEALSTPNFFEGCTETKNTLVFQDEDYVSFVVEVSNTGESPINNPLIIFAKQGLSEDNVNFGEAFGNYMTNAGDNRTYDFWFSWDDATINQTDVYDEAGVVVDYLTPSTVSANNWKILSNTWGFWSSNENDGDPYVMRTSNVELVSGNHTIGKGKTATFVFSIPARLWNSGEVKVLFYDMDSSLSHPTGNLLYPQDYLFYFKTLKPRYIDIDTSNEKVSGIPERSAFSSISIKNPKINMILDFKKQDSGELNIISAHGTVADITSCTDCLACFASNMESDSFRVLWMKSENDISGYPGIVDSQMNKIGSWVGAFFLPRAYSPRLRADLSSKYDEMRTNYSFDSGFSTMAYLTDDANKGTMIMDFYKSSVSPTGEVVFPQENASLFMAPDSTPITLRGIQSPDMSNTNYQAYIVNISINGGQEQKAILDENWVACINTPVADSDTVIVKIYDPLERPVHYSLPSLIRTENLPQSIDDYIGKITAEYVGTTRIALDENGYSPDWTWETNTFEFEASANDKVCIQLDIAPIISVPANGKVVFQKGDEYTVLPLDSDGAVNYDPGDFGSVTAFLINSTNDMIAGIKMENLMDVGCKPCADEECSYCDVNSPEFGFVVNVKGLPATGYMANATEYCSDSGSLTTHFSIEKQITEPDGSVAFTEIFSQNVAGCLWRLYVKDPDGVVTNSEFNITQLGTGAWAVLPTNSLVLDTKVLSGYSQGYEITIPAKGIDEMPIFVNTTWNDYGCNRALLVEKLDREPYVREVPYQVTNINTVTGTCTYLFIAKLNQTRTFQIFSGTFAPEMEYLPSWGSVDVQNLALLGDKINIGYRESCGNYQGPCVVAFTQDDIRCDPDTKFDKQGCGETTDFVSAGMFFDNAQIDIDTLTFSSINEPLRKCLVMEYMLLGNPVTSQMVTRTACIYAGVPAVFESMSTLNSPKERSMSNSMNRGMYDAVYLPFQIIKTDTKQEGTYYTDIQIFRGDPAVINKSVVIADNLITSGASTRKVDFYSSPASSTREAFVSNLQVSHFYGEENKLISFPDSAYFSNYTAAEKDFFMTVLPSSGALSNYFRENFEISNGSAPYYSRRWTDSGTSLNCQTSDDERKNVFGETCGYQVLDTFFGIMRTGIHEIKFKTITEGAGGTEPIKVRIYNEAGEEAQEMQYVTCSVRDGQFSCDIDMDEKGNAVIADKFGYVVGCLFLDDKNGELTDAAMSYYMPYVYPLKWDVSFNIVVSPHSKKLIPSYIVPGPYSFEYSFSGDGVCQPAVGEGCTTAPEDCRCYLTESQLHTNTTCKNNKCDFVCESNWGNCDDSWLNGCEANLLSTETCGGCGDEYRCYSLLANPNYHASEACVSGACSYTCNLRWENCDGDWSNGCETQDNHVTSSGATCSCETGYGDCNNDLGTSLSDGCEVDLSNNENNCGACGKICGNHAQCIGSACSCLIPWADCNNNLGTTGTDGCELNYMDLNMDSSCACKPGYADCNNDRTIGPSSNGCELNITAGNMDTSCNCLEGANHKYADCNNDISSGSSSDGCEVDLFTSNSNCGTCSRTCTGGTYCYYGECVSCTDDSQCDSLDGEYCASGSRVQRDYGCISGSCQVSSSTLIADCNTGNAVICAAGNVKQTWDGSCVENPNIRTTSCTTTLVSSEDCDNYNGIYCNGNIRQTRDYLCSTGPNNAPVPAFCDYLISSSENCAVAHCSSDVLYGVGTCSNGVCTNQLAYCVYHCSGSVCAQGYLCPARDCYKFGEFLGHCDPKCSSSSISYCDACGITCTSSTSCTYSCPPNMVYSGSQCVCSSGYFNCDGVWSNGCEVGGHVTSCYVCESGYANCNGNWLDGCETRLCTTANCARCNDRCSGGNYCNTDICMCIPIGTAPY